MTGLRKQAKRTWLAYQRPGKSLPVPDFLSPGIVGDSPARPLNLAGEVLFCEGPAYVIKLTPPTFPDFSLVTDLRVGRVKIL